MTIEIGTRIKLKHAVDRFPHFLAPEGMEGTVTVVEERLVCVKMDDHLEGAKEWENEIHWFEDMNILDDVEILEERKYLTVRYDVTDLTPDERSHLAFAASVQAEGDHANDFPGVESLEIDWEGVDWEAERKEARTFLVHLNVTIPGGHADVGEDEIGDAILTACEIASRTEWNPFKHMGLPVFGDGDLASGNGNPPIQAPLTEEV